MKNETAEWLNPMLDEAGSRQLDVPALMDQASMSAREVDWTALGKTDPEEFTGWPPGVRHMGIDWIRFGQLLRAELGWANYPPWPSETDEQEGQ